MTSILKKVVNSRTIRGFIFLSFLFSSVFLGVDIIQALMNAPEQNIFTEIKNDYVLMVSQCIIGMIAMFFPNLLKKWLHIHVPSTTLIIYSLFLYCAIYLGEMHSFYYQVPHWDTLLHLLSGAMFGILGYSVVHFLNKGNRLFMNVSPLFLSVFAFCFAVTLGVFWEIFEYLADIILGTNMQKYALDNLELLTGQLALKDTMKDLIVNCVGAFFISLIGFISLKYNKNWLENLLLKLEPRVDHKIRNY